MSTCYCCPRQTFLWPIHVFLAQPAAHDCYWEFYFYWEIGIGIGIAFVIELFTFVAAGLLLIYDPLPGINEP